MCQSSSIFSLIMSTRAQTASIVFYDHVEKANELAQLGLRTLNLHKEVHAASCLSVQVSDLTLEHLRALSVCQRFTALFPRLVAVEHVMPRKIALSSRG